MAVFGRLDIMVKWANPWMMNNAIMMDLGKLLKTLERIIAGIWRKI